MFGLWIIVSK